MINPDNIFHVLPVDDLEPHIQKCEFPLIGNPICKCKMRVGKSRKKLAEMIEYLLGEGSFVDPSKLYTNKGGNVYNDQYSWQGYVEDIDGNRLCVSSYNTMTEIVRHGKIDWVGRPDLFHREITII